MIFYYLSLDITPLDCKLVLIFYYSYSITVLDFLSIIFRYYDKTSPARRGLKVQ